VTLPLAFLAITFVPSQPFMEAQERPKKSSTAVADPPAWVIEAHRELIRWVAFSPDGETVATASFDGTLQLRSSKTGALKLTLRGHKPKAVWGNFAKDGNLFASGGLDETVRLWNPNSGDLVREFRGHQSGNWAGAISPDGNVIVSGGPDPTLFFWDAATGKSRLTVKHSAPVHWIAIAHNAHTVAVADGEGKVTLYDIATGMAQNRFGDHKGGISGIAFSPDDSLIATAGADAKANIWSTKKGEMKHSLPHFGAVNSVAFSPDGKRLVTGCADYSVRLWDIINGVFLSKLTGQTDAVWSVAFAPDGSRFASGGGDGKVMVWTKPPVGAAPRTKLPSGADLRPMFSRWKLSVIHQHSRGTCSVHVFTRALEFAVSKFEKRSIKLSDEYLNWACNQIIGNVGPKAADRGQFFEHLWMGFCKYGICERRLMPFTEAFNPGMEPSVAARENAKRLQNYHFAWHDISISQDLLKGAGIGVRDADVIKEVKSVLAAGWPVLAGFHHSVLVVGYVDSPVHAGGGYFIICDSGIGDSGTGGFVEEVTRYPWHSAIVYARVKDYGFSWIKCVSPLPHKPLDEK
jgi:sugar lactone lactonase YvrE